MSEHRAGKDTLLPRYQQSTHAAPACTQAPPATQSVKQSPLPPGHSGARRSAAWRSSRPRNGSQAGCLWGWRGGSGRGGGTWGGSRGAGGSGGVGAGQQDTSGRPAQRTIPVQRPQPPPPPPPTSPRTQAGLTGGEDDQEGLGGVREAGEDAPHGAKQDRALRPRPSQQCKEQAGRGGVCSSGGGGGRRVRAGQGGAAAGRHHGEQEQQLPRSSLHQTHRCTRTPCPPHHPRTRHHVQQRLFVALLEAGVELPRGALQVRVHRLLAQRRRLADGRLLQRQGAGGQGAGGVGSGQRRWWWLTRGRGERWGGSSSSQQHPCTPHRNAPSPIPHPPLPPNPSTTPTSTTRAHNAHRTHRSPCGYEAPPGAARARPPPFVGRWWRRRWGRVPRRMPTAGPPRRGSAGSRRPAAPPPARLRAWAREGAEVGWGRDSGGRDGGGGALHLSP